jgi:hypothetical protein
MKIVKVPTYYDYEDIENLREKFRQADPNEAVIFITADIDVIDFSLNDLIRLRKMIDKEISDRELMTPDERNKS